MTRSNNSDIRMVPHARYVCALLLEKKGGYRNNRESIGVNNWFISDVYAIKNNEQECKESFEDFARL